MSPISTMRLVIFSSNHNCDAPCKTFELCRVEYESNEIQQSRLNAKENVGTYKTTHINFGNLIFIHLSHPAPPNFLPFFSLLLSSVLASLLTSSMGICMFVTLCCIVTLAVAAAVICVVKHNIRHVRNGVASHLICVAKETEAKFSLISIAITHVCPL